MNKFKLSFLYRQTAIRQNTFLRLHTTLGDVIIQYCPCSEEFRIANGCEEWTYTFCVHEADLPAGLDVCNITEDIVEPPYLTAIPLVNFEDSNTVSFTGDGSEGNPFSANVNISSDDENGIEGRANGIYAEVAQDGKDGTDGTGLAVGSILFIPGTAPPVGMLELRGQTVDRTVYADLWTFAQSSGNLVADSTWELGNFSDGNGTTTFRIPDLRGEHVRGWDNGKGTDSGRAIGTWQDFMQETVTGSTFSTYLMCPRLGMSGAFSKSVPTGKAHTTTPDFTTSASMGELVFDSSDSSAKTGSETRPSNVALMGCIQALAT